MTAPLPVNGLRPLDYVVFGVMLCISLGIGVFFAVSGGRQKTTQEYLIGNRQMKMLPVAISMLVSFVSAIGILGNPAEIYGFGTQLMLYVVASSLGCIFGVLLFVPLFYPLHLTSSFEYLRMRYGSHVAELTGTVLALINQFLFNGIQLYAPSVALEAVSGFPIWASLIVCGITATIYTTIGGMKAVIWTDVFQFVVIVAGLLAIIIKGALMTGGMAEVWKQNEDWDRIHFFDFNPDPTVRMSFGSVVVMNTFLWLATTAAQSSVQRYCGLSTLTKARITVLLTIPGFVFLGLMTCLTGVIAFGYYARIGCDPFRAGYVKDPNQLLPYFVMEIFQKTPGLPGLFVACLFSASLSSVSSSLAALSAIAWESGLKHKLGHLSPLKQASITKLLSLGFGCIGIMTGFLVKQIGGTLIKITYSVMGTTIGPVAGMFILGATFPWAGTVGAVGGAAVGFAVTFWMAIGSSSLNVHHVPLRSPLHNCTTLQYAVLNATSDDVTYAFGVTTTPAPTPVSPDAVTGIQRIYLVSYLWYPFIAIVLVYTVGALLSCIPAFRHKHPVPRKLLFPGIRQCFCGGAIVKDDREADYNDNAHLAHKPFLAKDSRDKQPQTKEELL